MNGKGKKTSATQASMYKDLCLEGNARGKAPWGRTPILKGRGCLSYLLGVRKAGLVTLRVFSLQRFPARAFVVPLEEPKTGDNVLF